MRGFIDKTGIDDLKVAILYVFHRRTFSPISKKRFLNTKKIVDFLLFLLFRRSRRRIQDGYCVDKTLEGVPIGREDPKNVGPIAF
ncbi:hypothetical protein ES708_28603 [subsurface metagenome]